MAALYIDEDFDFDVVFWLDTFGLDVLTALGDHRAGLGVDDPDVLDRAITLKRAVITFNRKDYHRLHRSRSFHCGIVTCTRDEDAHSLAVRIHAAVSPLLSLDNLLIKIIRPHCP